MTEHHYPPFEQPELADFLCSPAFTASLLIAIEYTKSTRREAAFAAYRTGGGVRQSEVLRAEEVALPGDAKNTIRVASLLGDSEGYQRRDAIFSLHTHHERLKAGHDGTVPSAQDIRCMLTIARAVPGHIAGVTAMRTQDKTVNLSLHNLAFVDSNRMRIYLRSLHYQAKPGAIRARIMTSMGIKSVRIAYKYEDGELALPPDDELACLASLYQPPRFV